jgi:Spy/CpxP family protein refolding chaperone
MKLNRNVGLLVMAVASLGGAAGIAYAQSTSPSSSTDAITTAPATHGKWHHRGAGLMLGMTLRATRQLNLTAEQQASIQQILTNARAQTKAARAAGPAVDMVVLGNPGDPNYAAALQSAKTLASNRIQNESEVQAQVYNVLTAEQKAQLPTVLASLKAQAAQRRATWEQNHPSTTTG